MQILRIIDKQTKLFKRDDFTFDTNTEEGLNVEAAQGFAKVPEWDGSKWVESKTEWPKTEVKK